MRKFSFTFQLHHFFYLVLVFSLVCKQTDADLIKPKPRLEISKTDNVNDINERLKQELCWGNHALHFSHSIISITIFHSRDLPYFSQVDRGYVCITMRISFRLKLWRIEIFASISVAKHDTVTKSKCETRERAVYTWVNCQHQVCCFHFSKKENKTQDEIKQEKPSRPKKRSSFQPQFRLLTTNDVTSLPSIIFVLLFCFFFFNVLFFSFLHFGFHKTTPIKI